MQGLQRLPFPWRFHGGLDPNKLLEFYLPAILVAGAAAWGGVGAGAAAGARRWVPLIVVGLAYLLARTDEFHLVPLSVGARRRAGPRGGARAAGWRCGSPWRSRWG